MHTFSISFPLFHGERNIKAHKGAESMLSLFGDFQDAKTSGTWQSALKAWECRGRPWMPGLANMFSVFLFEL